MFWEKETIIITGFGNCFQRLSRIFIQIDLLKFPYIKHLLLPRNWTHYLHKCLHHLHIFGKNTICWNYFLLLWLFFKKKIFNLYFMCIICWHTTEGSPLSLLLFTWLPKIDTQFRVLYNKNLVVYLFYTSTNLSLEKKPHILSIIWFIRFFFVFNYR